MWKLGKWLREHRTLRKFSQAELAAQVGVAVSTVSRWERGGSSASVEEFRALCIALETSADAALGTGELRVHIIDRAGVAADLSICDFREMCLKFRAEREGDSDGEAEDKRQRQDCDRNTLVSGQAD
jgi:transcriptional regulator with XRE-family HTH domain